MNSKTEPVHSAGKHVAASQPRHKRPRISELSDIFHPENSLGRILSLGAADSGTAEFTITYEGSPTAVLHGGVVMPPDQWMAMPGGLFSAPLPNLGGLGVGVIGRGGDGSCTVTRAELFSDGMPMTLARYPNIASADSRLYNGPWIG